MSWTPFFDQLKLSSLATTRCVDYALVTVFTGMFEMKMKNKLFSRMKI